MRPLRRVDTNGWRDPAGRCGTRWQTKTADARPVHGPLHAPRCVTRVSHGTGLLARITVLHRKARSRADSFAEELFRSFIRGAIKVGWDVVDDRCAPPD